jgi:hypothetical protein
MSDRVSHSGPRLAEKDVLPTAAVPAAPMPTSEDTRRPTDAPPSRLRRLISNRRVQSVAATAGYAAFAIYLTWPLAADLDSTIYGAVGDLTGSISVHREIVESHKFPFVAGTLPDFNAPEGLAIRWTLNIATLPSFSAMYLLTAAIGPIAAIGLYTLLGFVLSGVAMFLLVRRLIGDPGVAFVAGFAYAFYPFVVIKAQGHVDFVHGWVLVVLAWRLIELLERPTLRNGIWGGLALLLVFSWTPYHILFGGVMALGLAAVAVVFAWRRGLLRQTLAALAVVAGMGVIWMGAMALLNTFAPRDEVRAHTIQEAIAYSARAEEYVVPTSEHPLVGRAAGEYRQKHLHGSNASENTLYVGFTVLALALIGLIAAVWNAGAVRRAAVLAVVFAVTGFAFSAPPEVDLLGLNFPTATQFLFDFTSTWRVFSRLVVVVMLGLVLLAAMGMWSIMRRVPSALKSALLLLLLVVVMGDLWAARPAHGTNEVAAPATYERLARMPDGIAVEYPLLPAEQSSYADVYYQGWHDKPIMNGYLPKTAEENRALRLDDLSKSETASGLKALGVRYVLVRQDLEAAGLPDPGRPGPAFRLVTKDSFIALYELRDGRPGTLVMPWDGFLPTEEIEGGRFQWLAEDDGTIEVRGSCSPCIGTLKMTVRSFDHRRDVTVQGPDGRVLAQARNMDKRTLRFPVRFDRKLTLRIEARPGPERISTSGESADPRSVSISIANESLRLSGAGER